MHLMAARIQTVVQDLIKARGLTMARVKEKWYYIPIAAFLAAAALLYAIVGGGAHIAVQDNLDLFQAQYAMMKRTGTFFTQGAAAPFLGGISRDVLPSEFSLTALFYELFPPLAAYLLNYFCKIAVATASFALFAREICRIRWERLFTRKGFTPSPQLVQHEKALSVLCGFCYGLLNVFPAFGISFASIPLALYLLVKLWRAESRKDAAKYLAGLFLYPLLSYFSYFGLFLLGYVLAAWIIFTVRALIKREKSARKLPVRLFLAMAVLSAGYICFEYRLFRQMLFSDEVSIRSTIKMASLPLSGALREGLDVMINGMFHADGMQKYVILPLLVIWIVATALIRLQQNDMGPGIFRHKVLDGMDGAFSWKLIPWILLTIVFNCAVYGIYYFEPVRSLVETLVPQLKGWQFGRTIFFNPFLWYLILFLICRDLAAYAEQVAAFAPTGKGRKSGENAVSHNDRNESRNSAAALPGKRSDQPDADDGRTGKRFALLIIAVYGLVFAAGIAILVRPTNYNDLYKTAHAEAYELLRGQKENDLSYDELYSVELFEQIKEDIGYPDLRSTELQPAQLLVSTSASPAGSIWSVAYGFYPAILEYNGIATLDGYLGFYSQAYKEAFREVIAPALEKRPAPKQYFDDWGARGYLYSGSQDTIVQPVRNYPTQEEDADINADALRRLGCRYIFSRIRITNAEELGLSLRGTYEDAAVSPYTVYLYEL